MRLECNEDAMICRLDTPQRRLNGVAHGLCMRVLVRRDLLLYCLGLGLVVDAVSLVRRQAENSYRV